MPQQHCLHLHQIPSFFSQENLDEPKAPLTEPWEPIAPHDALVAPKPPKKARRRTTKGPSGNSSKNTSNSVLKKALENSSSRRRNKRAEAGASGEGGDAKPPGVPVKVVTVAQFLIQDIRSLGGSGVGASTSGRGQSGEMAPEFEVRASVFILLLFNCTTNILRFFYYSSEVFHISDFLHFFAGFGSRGGNRPQGP